MAKDTTTYNFNGKKNLKKRNLVKEIIQKYIKDNPNIDYHQLKNIFNDKELKKKKIILDKNDYLDWKKDKKDKQDRYFPPIVLGNKESLEIESFENNILEAPTFTKPKSYKNLKNSEVISEFFKGNHSIISSLKENLALAKTKYHRPDIYKKLKIRKKYEK